MWNDQRDQGNWSGGPPREGGLWSGPGGSEPGPPSWGGPGSFDQQPPWGNQPDQPPWGQREPSFPPRMQACAGFGSLLSVLMCFSNCYCAFSNRDLHISGGLSLHTSSHLRSVSPRPPLTTLAAFPLVLCRTTSLRGTISRGLRTTRTALTIPRGNILQVRGGQSGINVSVFILGLM